MPRRQYPHAPFPVQWLKIADASLQCIAHKNDYTELHVDWCFTLSFKPMTIMGRECQCNIMVQLETPDARRLDDFAGLKHRDKSTDFNIGSFYLFDHRPSADTKFCVHSVKKNVLDVEVSIKADLGDSYVDPDPPMSVVNARAKVKFEGFSISSSSVQCRHNRKAVMKVAGKLIDLDQLGPPSTIKDSHRKGHVNLEFPAK